MAGNNAIPIGDYQQRTTAAVPNSDIGAMTGGAPPLRQTQRVTTGYGGEDLANLASGMTALGMQIANSNEEHARAWSASIMSGTRLQWTKELQDRQANATDGADGFTPKLIEDFDKYALATIEKAPTPAAKRYLGTRLSEFKAGLGETALQFESKARIDYRTDQFSKAIDDTEKLMNTDPTQFQSALHEQLTLIDGAALPPIQKSALRQKAQDRIAASAVWSEIQRSPTNWLDSIGFYSKPGEVLKPAGQIEPGNVDLHNRPVVRNADGSISTVRSISFNDNGQEVLIPTVVGGKIVSNDEAIANYRKTGQHLGKFDKPENATAYAINLHGEQAAEYGDGKQKINKTQGSLRGSTGNSAFDTLPFERRVQMFEAAIRLKASIDANGDSAVGKRGKELQDAAMKEGWSRLFSDKLDRDYIESVRPILTSEQYHSLYTALNKPEKGTDDPATFRDLQMAVVKRPGQAINMAYTAHKAGLISNETLASAVSRAEGMISRDRSESRQEGPKSTYERGREYIIRSMDPGPLVSDPVGKGRLAEALSAYDSWYQGGKHTDKEVDDRQREITSQYKMINLGETVLGLPMPRSGAIRRAPADRPGMMQDISKAVKEAQRRLATKQYSQSEYNQDMVILNRWRTAAEGQR